MRKHICLMLVLLAAMIVMSACHSDPDPWQSPPANVTSTAAPSAQPIEEGQAEKETQQPDPEPTPGGESEPGLNG